MTKHYKLPLKDKAALLNRFEKVGVQVDSFDIKDNKLDDTFEFVVNDSNTQKTIDTVLKQSSKIDVLKELLRNVIREELKNVRNKE